MHFVDLAYRVATLLPVSSLKNLVLIFLELGSYTGIETQLHWDLPSPPSMFTGLQRELACLGSRVGSQVAFGTAPNSPSCVPLWANQANQNPWITWVARCSLGWPANDL